ncbi:chloroplast ferredoxin [Haematococcus lacustris]|uniref:Chloroplast ferredoxin n=1 Tax=Haematococcus lacustris TaxID=44745 RepID=A0A699Z1V1_HAELA|nr:chloroplast ferredoxin [Haematococcus lacustris]
MRHCMTKLGLSRALRDVPGLDPRDIPWPKEGQWFVGVVTDYRPRDNKYCITYDVGTKNESMEWYDIMAAEAVGDPQSSVLNPKSKKAGGGPGNQAAKLSPSCSADLSVGALTPTSRTGAPKKHKLMSALMV